MTTLMIGFEGALDWFAMVNWNTVRWTDLLDIQNFRWKYGITPFSSLQVPVFILIVYLTTLFSLQNYMKDKKAYKLNSLSLIHNLFLTALSLFMFVGAAYGAYLKYQSQGFFAGLVCEQDRNPIHGPLFYFSYIFYLSKFYELLDSYLLVLKKKPLIFLHVFHHSVMPFVCWAGLEGKWCMALWTSAFWNSFVHVVMYFYYTLNCFGYNPWWKKYLTILQIYQFVSGVLYTSVYFYYYFAKFSYESTGYTSTFTFSQGCTGELWAIVFMFSVNCSFLLLFTQWYLAAYSRPKKSGENQPIQNKK